MYHTITDVMNDYVDAAGAAGIPDDEMLSEDEVRNICHELGRYEEIDRDRLLDRLWEATGGPGLRDVMSR